MSVSYDPEKAPKIPFALAQEAERMGMKIVRVMCSRRNSGPGEPGSVDFFALADFLPRVGEMLVTQDRKPCRVREVLHWVCPVGPQGQRTGFGLMHVVNAELTEADDLDRPGPPEPLPS